MPARISQKNNNKNKTGKGNKKSRKFQKGGAQGSATGTLKRALPKPPVDKEQALKEAIKFAKQSNYNKAVANLMTAYGEELKELEELNDNAKNYFKIIGYLKHNELTKSNNNSELYAAVGEDNPNLYELPVPLASQEWSNVYRVSGNPKSYSTSTTYNAPATLPLTKRSQKIELFNKSNPFS